MDSHRLTLLLGASLLVLPVTGCMDGAAGIGKAPASEATAFAERPAASRFVEQDVEAPEVFQVSDTGLWDGRPSLGGVWVAHPDVKDPERVVIRNEDNGRFVIGALFRRERDNPGPKLQVSSDAAAALGLLAGQPTPLNVTALRREEPSKEEPAAEMAEATEPAPAPVAAEPIPETIVAEAPPAPAAEATATGEPIAAGTIGGNEAGTAVATEMPPAEPVAEFASAETVTKPRSGTKRNWNPFRRLMPARAAAPAEPLSAIAPAAPLAGAEAVSTEPLPAIADEAAAAPEAIAETRASGQKITKPYVQLGIFSVEQNANNTAEAMRQNGVSPKVFEQESSGKTFWRVVVGPANSESDRAAMLRKVKDLGFTDAYPVSG